MKIVMFSLLKAYGSYEAALEQCLLIKLPLSNANCRLETKKRSNSIYLSGWGFFIIILTNNRHKQYICLKQYLLSAASINGINSLKLFHFLKTAFFIRFI